MKKSKSRDKFLKWHRKLEKLLQSHWENRQGAKLSIAHCMKCVDAYIAWIVRIDYGDIAVSLALENVANCLLDQQILLKLNECYSNMLPIGPKTVYEEYNRY